MATVLGVALLSGALLLPAVGANIRVVPFDSGTRVIREVAESLTGKGRSILEAYPWGSDLFLGFVSLFPESARISAIEWGMRMSLGLAPDRADDVSIDALAQWCVSQYPESTQYPVIVIGSPNGAVAHLASLLGAPFLTTSFGLAFRHPTIDPDDVDAYRRTSSAVAARIMASNSGGSYEIVCHDDPLHDRSMVRVADFLRIKLLDLPDCYRTFLQERLAPGGTVVLVDCTYSWPQIPIEPGIFLQIGGLGGVASTTYLERWGIADPVEMRRESEWGCPEAFAEAVRTFSSEGGIRLIEIARDHPADYSLLAYNAYLACDGARSDFVLIDCFNHLHPTTNLETGIPALWLPFNTIDGLDLVHRILNGKRLSSIYLAPLPSFASSPDTVPLHAWFDEIEPYGPLSWIGIHPALYPADPLAPYRFVRDLAALQKTLALPFSLRLSLETLDSLLDSETR